VSLQVAVRVDASTAIGTGHLMRCLTLADGLRARGAAVRFVTRGLPPDLADLIGDRGHDVAVLRTDRVSEAEDARDTVDVLSDRAWSWVIVDHYGLGATWERAMRASATSVMAIDDLANRVHECDLLLDQNYLALGAARYEGKVPPACHVLTGPRFALLRPEYHTWRSRVSPRTGTVSRVLVFFGGTDPHDMTTLALEALSHPTLSHLAVDVVATVEPRRRAALERLTETRPGITLFGRRPHLADLMAQADLAIGAGGSTTWERMCLGLRSVVITLADNQVEVADWLAHEGLIRLVGAAGEVTSADVRAAVLDELERGEAHASIPQGMALCDGLGVARISSAMLEVEALT